MVECGRDQFGGPVAALLAGALAATHEEADECAGQTLALAVDFLRPGGEARDVQPGRLHGGPQRGTSITSSHGKPPARSRVGVPPVRMTSDIYSLHVDAYRVKRVA
ncbi:acyl-CoA thioesterase domain-containing protein [Streptomyces sp. BH034]|uniref:acyl-CoA thioesterase domain-containing protein n=1 Tax=Streptomyces sp. BH034 TaxID=3402626 RepID=UPI003BB74EE4